MKRSISTLILLLCLRLSAEVQPSPLPEGPLERIAFGSCAKHWQAQPIWQAVLRQNPDLWPFLGDNVYDDTDGASAWEERELMMSIIPVEGQERTLHRMSFPGTVDSN